MYRNSLSPPVFPATWASDWGEDQFGLWMAFTLKGVRQAFRWCEPGTFLMGSPEDEPERYDDETLHEVTLTRGFWLADTTVTQELWQAVMGKNPSEFKGADRPVEQVSWEDVQEFLGKLNKLVPELSARLPWEAEWEYGCRAGTTTPFSFGENIMTDQVNYDGNSPYNNGAKGEYRGETVTVKSLPCNNRGLYEMHGNVWEWCADWYNENYYYYGNSSVRNPTGPSSGSYRIFRGGGWRNPPWYLRSANRGRYGPEYRLNALGFRLVASRLAQ